MNKWTLLYILFTIQTSYAQTPKDDPFLKIYNTNEERYALGIPDEPVLMVYNYKGKEVHIKLFKDPSTNCKINKKECKIYYSPLMYFMEDPNKKNYPWIRVINSYQRYSIVKMKLVIFNDYMKREILNLLFKHYGKVLDVHNLSPLPITQIFVQYDLDDIPYEAYDDFPEGESKQVYAQYPDRSFPFELKSTLANTIELDFFVPKGYEDYIVRRFRNGTSLKIRYNYITSEFKENRSISNITIRLNSDLIRDFSGGREKIYASKSQILSFVTDALIDYQAHNYIEDETFLSYFQNISAQILNSAINNAKELGELNNEFISLYKLDDQDTFLSPDFTSKTKNILKRESDSHDSLKQYSKRLRSTNLNAQGKLLFLKGNLSYQRSKEDIQSNEHIQSKSDLFYQETDWEGLKVNPLSIKMYEVSTSKIKQSFSVDETYILKGNAKGSSLSQIRNTTTHLSK